jgi:uncharacterized protein (DUF952 family)
MQGAIFSAMSPTTYHLVPRSEWEAANPDVPFAPAAFDVDGFVHCTDGADELAATANRYFATFDGELLAVVIDVERLSAPVRYEDAARIYPHVYGPLDREAVLDVLVMPRDANGVYLTPA